MKKMHLFGIAIRRRKRYSSYRGTVGEIKPNLICRNFLAILPDRKWYSDITEFHLNGEKLYLSPIMDGVYPWDNFLYIKSPSSFRTGNDHAWPSL